MSITAHPQIRIPSGTYQIDTAHSTIGFAARYAMVSKVRGTFTEFDGKAVVAENLADSTAAITIEVDSLSTHQEQRDAHLRSADFFDIENHPQITFVSTSVVPREDQLSVTGDLTIKGTTRTISIDFEHTGSARDAFGNERVGFAGFVRVNRRDWGLTWNVALEAGGVMVSENVTLELEISLIRTV
jgi:polyisoprenoid-binding protein YceI